MTRCCLCQYAKYSAKEEEIMILVGLLRRKMSLIKHIHYLKRLYWVFLPPVAMAVRPLEDCENDAGTTQSFPPNFMG